MSNYTTVINVCLIYANKSDKKLNKYQVKNFIILKVKNKKQKIWLKGLKIWTKIKGLKLNKEKYRLTDVALPTSCKVHRLLH